MSVPAGTQRAIHRIENPGSLIVELHRAFQGSQRSSTRHEQDIDEIHLLLRQGWTLDFEVLVTPPLQWNAH